MNDILSKDLTKTLGLDELSEEEQLVFLEKMGSVILESSVLRLVAGLTEDQQTALDHYLESDPEPADLLKHLTDNYEAFNQIFEEEVIAMKEEAVAVLGEPAAE